MKEPKPVSAIVFDAYGTLFDIACIDRRLAHHFGDRAPEAAVLWRRKQLEYTWLRTLMDRYRRFYDLTSDALRYTCENLGLSADDRLIADLMDHYDRLDVYGDVPGALARLGEQYQLAILSNADRDLLDRAIAHNRLGRDLTGIFSAEAIGRYKPSPAVYDLPATGLGIDADRLLFASSNSWDVAGARAAGLRVAWIRRGGGGPEHLGETPDIIARDLTELADQLAAL